MSLFRLWSFTCIISKAYNNPFGIRNSNPIYEWEDRLRLMDLAKVVWLGDHIAYLASGSVFCLLFLADFFVLCAKTSYCLTKYTGCHYNGSTTVCLFTLLSSLDRAPWGPSLVHSTQHRAWYRPSLDKTLFNDKRILESRIIETCPFLHLVES